MQKKGRSDEQLEEAKKQARRALDAALSSQAADLDTECSPEALDVAKGRALAALEAAVFAEPDSDVTETEMKLLKEKAKDALTASLQGMGNDAERIHGVEELTQAQERALAAFVAELDELRLRVQSALHAILTGEDKLDVNVGALKSQAREALNAALLAEAVTQHQDTTSQ